MSEPIIAGRIKREAREKAKAKQKAKSRGTPNRPGPKPASVLHPSPSAKFITIPRPEPFPRTVYLAVDAKIALARLHATPKLSAESFMRTAIDELVEGGVARVDAARHKIAQSRTTPSLMPLIRHFARLFSEPNFSRPPPADRVMKMFLAYGSANNLPELATISVTPGELIAVAAQDATARFPERFGDPESNHSWSEYLAKIEAAEKAYATALEAVRTGWTNADVTIDPLPGEADKRENKARIWFTAFAPSGPFGDDWPAKLIAAVMNSTDPAHAGEIARHQARLRHGAKLSDQADLNGNGHASLTTSETRIIRRPPPDAPPPERTPPTVERDKSVRRQGQAATMLQE